MSATKVPSLIAVGSMVLAACGSNTPEAPEGVDPGPEDAGVDAQPQDTGAQQDSAAQQETSPPVLDATGDVDPGLDATPQKPYPEGPYGYDVNSILKNYKFLGWKNPAAVSYTGELEPVELADYYDPDGTKGIKALFINASAIWCVVCGSEQRDIAYQKDKWEPQGVRFLETLFEDETGYEPADPTDLSSWASTYEIDWTLVLDPSNQFSPFFDRAATPMNMIVDTRTMRIVEVSTGAPTSTWWEQYLGPLVEP